MFKIQRRKVKCKKCHKELYNTEAYQVIEGTKKLYFCTEKEYQEILKEKQEHDSCLETIAEITDTKFVTPIMLKKVNEIRGFYDYSIIERTFKEYKSTIQWALENREFNSEFAQAKYIISIIANNISKVCKEVNKERKELERLFKTNDNNVEIEIMDLSINREIKNKEVSDISMFLD